MATLLHVDVSKDNIVMLCQKLFKEAFFRDLKKVMKNIYEELTIPYPKLVPRLQILAIKNL